MPRNLARFSTKATLRLFQFLAYAEGGLLPSILIVAIYHWITGRAKFLVVIVGATHGTVFTAYILIVPVIAWILRWPWRTTSIAISVAFVPFATWNFERKNHSAIVSRLEQPSAKSEN